MIIDCRCSHDVLPVCIPCPHPAASCFTALPPASLGLSAIWSLIRSIGCRALRDRYRAKLAAGWFEPIRPRTHAQDAAEMRAMMVELSKGHNNLQASQASIMDSKPHLCQCGCSVSE